MEFTEILQAILKARYGKDVRQAIHDGIKACKDAVDAGLEEYDKKLSDTLTENQKKLFDIIMPIWNVLADELSVEVINGAVWGTSGGVSILVQATANSQYTWMDVRPGDVYWVRASHEDESAYATVMLTYGGAVDGTDGNIVDRINDPYVAGTHDYFVTIPEGSNVDTMLISSDGEAVKKIRVWKVNADKLDPYKSITGAATI